MIVITRHGVLVAHAAPAEAPGEREVSKVEPLARFLDPSRASRAAVYRLDPAQVAQATTHAEQAADAARSMAQRGIPFDYRFDVTTPDALYCTELVLRAYAQAGVDLQVHTSTTLPFLPQPVIFPADLIRSPRIRRVDQPRAGQLPPDALTAP